MKSLLLLGAAAAALLFSSCNTVSGLGQDLQDASTAVQNP
ncbi:MAG: entericidin EcnA/B family protein [Akkermansiaceae bacterium]|nr:entericidin EcnA/B family protein [Akkermansiaceae bacterium]